VRRKTLEVAHADEQPFRRLRRVEAVNALNLADPFVESWHLSQESFVSARISWGFPRPAQLWQDREIGKKAIKFQSQSRHEQGKLHAGNNNKLL
jgi:hypothetical protein